MGGDVTFTLEKLREDLGRRTADRSTSHYGSEIKRIFESNMFRKVGEPGLAQQAKNVPA